MQMLDGFGLDWGVSYHPIELAFWMEKVIVWVDQQYGCFRIHGVLVVVDARCLLLTISRRRVGGSMVYMSLWDLDFSDFLHPGCALATALCIRSDPR